MNEMIKNVLCSTLIAESLRVVIKKQARKIKVSHGFFVC